MFALSLFVLFCIFACDQVFWAQAADTVYLKTTIGERFSQNRHHLVNPTYKNAARDFIEAEFKRFGLDVTRQDFQGSGYRDLNGRTFTNVIGVLKGARFGKSNDAILGIGAHYDTVQITSGVDDNGAGVAAMLESARRLTSEYENIQNTIVFVAFDIEEYLFYADGIGSQKLLQIWLPAWLQSNYGSANPTFNGVIVLDTVMNYNSTINAQEIPGNATMFQRAFPSVYKSITSDGLRGDFLAVIYRAASDDVKLASGMASSWSTRGTPKFEIESFSLPLPQKAIDLQNPAFQDFLRSDHYHFWKNDMAAIFITDSANLRGRMEECYHHECDNKAVMLTDENVAFLGKTSDTMTDAIGRLSGGKMRTSSGSTLKMSAFLVAFVALFALL